ncbi:hypothetical protein [Nonomuraea jiangxiensis]|uniref:Alpha amylase inhibitor n=1 Tax=Nonomuraea jiangxiensis TaxID=633440 RepID=A0A1G9IDN2_9ACTN|nr:hypothetical protein [Nonomuraea jiangxiensis]SDL23341.1 hypothetical protein SAMN05421869_123158 [Nonomuraea jiangxiensis]
MFKTMRVAAAVAGSAALLSLGLAAPASAATYLNCRTFVHHNDNYLGIAFCSNPMGQTWRFRAVITCGWAPDVVGEWVTLAPGGIGQSQGTCGRLGSGVGAVGVDERRV